MSDYLKMELYRRAYLPMCALNIILAYISVGFALWVSAETYLSGMSKSNLMTVFEVVGYASAAIIFHCNFMISSGGIFWLKAAAGVLIVCLMIALPSIAYGADWLIYVIAILFPVLGLLSLGSNRHRKFCSDFMDLRRLRAASALYNDAKALRGGKRNNSRRRYEANSLAEKVSVHVKSKSQVQARVRYLISIRILIRLGCTIFAGLSVLMIWSAARLIYNGLATGVVVGSSRYGPLPYYSISQAPWAYGLSMLMLVFAIFLFLLVLKLSILFIKATFEE
jgi:hypothetical protein